MKTNTMRIYDVEWNCLTLSGPMDYFYIDAEDKKQVKIYNGPDYRSGFDCLLYRIGDDGKIKVKLYNPQWAWVIKLDGKKLDRRYEIPAEGIELDPRITLPMLESIARCSFDRGLRTEIHFTFEGMVKLRDEARIAFNGFSVEMREVFDRLTPEEREGARFPSAKSKLEALIGP